MDATPAPRLTIRTRYVTRPGSNVGTYRATGAGRTFTAPARLDLSFEDRAEIAARGLAAIIAGADPADIRAWALAVPTRPQWGNRHAYAPHAMPELRTRALRATLSDGADNPERVAIKRGGSQHPRTPRNMGDGVTVSDPWRVWEVQL
jgi:hypothetical protein